MEMPAGSILVEGEYTARDYELGRRDLAPLRPVTVLTIAAASTLVAFVTTDSGLGSLAWGAFFTGLVVAMIRLQRRSWAKKRFALAGTSERKMRLVFSEEGVEMTSPSSNGHTKYEGFSRFVEGTDTLLLYLAAGEVAILIPKRWCSESELPLLTARLHARIVPRAIVTPRLGLGLGVLLWLGTVLICLGLWHLLAP